VKSTALLPKPLPGTHKSTKAFDVLRFSYGKQMSCPSLKQRRLRQQFECKSIVVFSRMTQSRCSSCNSRSSSKTSCRRSDSSSSGRSNVVAVVAVVVVVVVVAV
jgi:hypothetical protein